MPAVSHVRGASLERPSLLFRIDIGHAVAASGGGLKAGLIIIKLAVGAGAGCAVAPAPGDAERRRAAVGRGPFGGGRDWCHHAQGDGDGRQRGKACF